MTNDERRGQQEQKLELLAAVADSWVSCSPTATTTTFAYKYLAPRAPRLLFARNMVRDPATASFKVRRQILLSARLINFPENT